eukprot:COSAG02_NODE_1128_length_14425_cov_18.666271_12_plen_104_part_00
MACVPKPAETCSKVRSMLLLLGRHVYEHFWKPGDFVVYDNRSTIHSTVAYSGERHLHLMGFKGKVGQKGVPIRVGNVTADAADIETFWWKHHPQIQRPGKLDE